MRAPANRAFPADRAASCRALRAAIAGGLLLIAACSPACSSGSKTADPSGATTTAGGVAAPPVDVPPVVKPPKTPFKPKKLSCTLLLEAARAKELLGFDVKLIERANKRDGETSLLCTHDSVAPSQALSFLVSCGKKDAPAADFARLFKIHEKLAGAQLLPEGRGVSAPTSHLARHPYRPCFVEVACRAPVLRPGGAARIAAEIAAALP